ncbi:hypothetical protein FVE85_1690 [Porphyridium purpureum]|uniref:Uncharacterized protein n=1 Tax=Porphyridium purpureum TaxID=35688 RepID=A0A5J4YWJ7_PORPP|nr:hypothetical protein FVE85_1690 [Porphyridium purpureum]|eukprot:POR5488..scf209_3
MLRKSSSAGGATTSLPLCQDDKMSNSEKIGSPQNRRKGKKPISISQTPLPESGSGTSADMVQDALILWHWPRGLQPLDLWSSKRIGFACANKNDPLTRVVKSCRKSAVEAALISHACSHIMSNRKAARGQNAATGKQKFAVLSLVLFVLRSKAWSRFSTLIVQNMPEMFGSMAQAYGHKPRLKCFLTLALRECAIRVPESAGQAHAVAQKYGLEAQITFANDFERAQSWRPLLQDVTRACDEIEAALLLLVEDFNHEISAKHTDDHPALQSLHAQTEVVEGFLNVGENADNAFVLDALSENMRVLFGRRMLLELALLDLKRMKQPGPHEVERASQLDDRVKRLVQTVVRFGLRSRRKVEEVGDSAEENWTDFDFELVDEVGL